MDITSTSLYGGICHRLSIRIMSQYQDKGGVSRCGALEFLFNSGMIEWKAELTAAKTRIVVRMDWRGVPYSIFQMKPCYYPLISPIVANWKSCVFSFSDRGHEHMMDLCESEKKAINSLANILYPGRRKTISNFFSSIGKSMSDGVFGGSYLEEDDNWESEEDERKWDGVLVREGHVLSLSTPLSITLDSTMGELLSTSFPYLRTLKFDVERMEDAGSFFLQLADQSTVIDLQINCHFGDNNERDYSFLDYIHFNTQLRCLSITNDQSTNNRGSIY